jgi:hypothetical protein
LLKKTDPSASASSISFFVVNTVALILRALLFALTARHYYLVGGVGERKIHLFGIIFRFGVVFFFNIGYNVIRNITFGFGGML